MNTRPALVAAHTVPVFCGARAIHATAPPMRVMPYTGGWGGFCVTGVVSVRSVAFGGPIRTKLPQPGCPAKVVNSGQLASRYVGSPPQSCVRQTENDPWKIEPARAGFGSAMIGG